MKFRLLVGFLLALSCASLAHAAGTCPSGAPVTGANCWFVAATGSDSSYDGTTETISGSHGPFLHAPGMPNCASNCASAMSTSPNSSAAGIGGII
jgi:hypothetical protein